MYCFGADIGGTTVKLGLFDAEGKLLEKWEIPSRTENEGAAILPDIAEAILSCMERRGITREDTIGIGMGVPAAVSRDGVVPYTTNLGWGYKEATRELTELTGLPSKAANDANVAALGEMWLGGGRGHRDVLMVTLGTGVGGGIVIDGHILTGAHGAAGEVGHIHANDEIQEHCGCGNRGCLEQFASATGLARLGREALQSSDKPSILRGQEISAKTIFDALKAGDALAEEIVECFADYLGKGIAAMTAVIDPEVVVIGGGVSKAGPILIEYVQRRYRIYAYEAARDTKLVLAELGNDAGICGCARLILD